MAFEIIKRDRDGRSTQGAMLVRLMPRKKGFYISFSTWLSKAMGWRPGDYIGIKIDRNEGLMRIGKVLTGNEGAFRLYACGKSGALYVQTNAANFAVSRKGKFQVWAQNIHLSGDGFTFSYVEESARKATTINGAAVATLQRGSKIRSIQSIINDSAF